MKSQRGIRFFLPLLVILIAGVGELAGQWGSSVEPFPWAVPSVPHLFAEGQHQEGEEQSPAEPRPLEPDRWSADQRRADRLNMVKRWKLTEYLELSREQADTFMLRTNEHERQVNTNVLQQRELYDNFQQKIRGGEINAEEVEQYIAEKARLEKARIDLQNSYLQGMKDLLSDEQLAKLAVFEEYFIIEIGEELHRNQP